MSIHKRKLNENHIKAIFFIGLLLVLAGIYAAIPDFYSTVWELSVSGNMHGTIAYLRSFGIWAMLVSMIIDIVINIVGFLPSIFISTANGVLFGIYVGTLVSWLGETIGVIISFFFMRTLFRKSAETLIKKSKMLSKLDRYSTLKAMIAARAVPYAPNGLVTALGALSSISYRDYVIGCLIGKLPSVAIEVILGHDVVNYEEHAMRLTIVTIAVVIVYGGLWYWNRRRKTTALAKAVESKIDQDRKSHDV
ncbi:MAG: TVP38/TMEM64 family protein [Megasphaera sp.]|uniref:TVP38/TMEM64 family protein n=1 Tax=Megasphaera sueciensis TaxID=349094 RepID=UPI003CFDD72B|nr:TVP38/TMEM64 family protein [Megasphaera sp.]MCI1822600.1 TVP38/TMEM64 family protein [Megasphaera sp.]